MYAFKILLQYASVISHAPLTRWHLALTPIACHLITLWLWLSHCTLQRNKFTLQIDHSCIFGQWLYTFKTRWWAHKLWATTYTLGLFFAIECRVEKFHKNIWKCIHSIFLLKPQSLAHLQKLSLFPQRFPDRIDSSLTQSPTWPQSPSCKFWPAAGRKQSNSIPGNLRGNSDSCQSINSQLASWGKREGDGQRLAWNSTSLAVRLKNLQYPVLWKKRGMLNFLLQEKMPNMLRCHGYWRQIQNC